MEPAALVELVNQIGRPVNERKEPAMSLRIVWIGLLVVAGLASSLVAASPPEPVTLPQDRRPQWLAGEGLVMAGNWEPLFFRVRRGPRGRTPAEAMPPAGAQGYTPTATQQALYWKDHGPEMIARLKELGANFVMIHGYKGAGLEAERQSMAESAEFTRRYHAAGMHVGVYVDSGTIFEDLMLKEVPGAKEWVLLDAQGKRVTFPGAPYRWRYNRNHPDAHAYALRVVQHIITEVKPDLIHFDNYLWGPGHDASSVARFREYLRQTFTPAELAAGGIADLDAVRSADGPPGSLRRMAWLEFTSRSLAESYRARTQFARTLQPEILIECNPHGVQQAIRAPIDHVRLTAGGEAFWDEGRGPVFRDGKVIGSRIRTYKVARRMKNMAFAYNTNPLELAEAMAFNLDCLGCVCFYEFGFVRNRPWTDVGVLPESPPYIRFYRQRRDLFAGTEVVADVAVLRSFPSQLFASGGERTGTVEQALIDSCACFQIVGDDLADLARYRVLVLAHCPALSDEQVRKIRRYVETGGRICTIGPAATADEWARPRPKSGLDDLPAARLTRAASTVDPPTALAAVRRTCGEHWTLTLDAGSPADRGPSGVPPGLAAEVTEKPATRMVHLVNYRPEPVRQIAVRLRLPAGKKARSVMLASPARQADEAVPFRNAAGAVEFTVPEVAVYQVGIVHLE